MTTARSNKSIRLSIFQKHYCIAVCLCVSVAVLFFVYNHLRPGSPVTVIVTFPLITDPRYDTKHLSGVSGESMETRMVDFVQCLEHTLKHPKVHKVYLLYDQDALPLFVNTRLWNQPKLILKRLRNGFAFLDFFEFIHGKLQDELVMVLAGDVYPGEGLDKLDYSLIKSKRLFYSINSQGRREKRCDMSSNTCDGSWRDASHDSYIFVPSGKIPPNAQAMLITTWDHYGMDISIPYMYSKQLHYQVINPCYVVYLYRIHCSELRHPSKWVKTDLFS